MGEENGPRGALGVVERTLTGHGRKGSRTRNRQFEGDGLQGAADSLSPTDANDKRDCMFARGRVVCTATSRCRRAGVATNHFDNGYD